ncbi:hypothetical protein GIB67_006218 [Kingdonia uniflora]|uniref:Uncharacterized protein n=1 Tax=Kingdonia uniflora TaxID=39325 RepID=A0A7J7P529_9MAGN|nr:hypothetical protein GIB67_006218 [Kingdonia uniflora]
MGYPPCVNYTCDYANPRTWPQLLGKPANVAKAIIERDVPEVAVILRTSDNYGIFDFCCNRVWLYVDNDARHTVNAVPKIG